MCKLTDWQVDELVVGPAVARSKKDGAGGRPKKADRLPTRDEYVKVGVATFGGDPEALGREYDRVMGGADGGSGGGPE